MAHAEQRARRPRAGRGLLLLTTPLIAVLALRFFAAFLHGQEWWGIDIGRYLPMWQAVVIAAAGLAVALLAAVPAGAARMTALLYAAGEFLFPDNPSSMRARHAAAALCFGLLAVLVTMPFPFLGGDGVHVVRRLYRFNIDVLASYGQLRTEPLTVLLYAWLAKLTGAGSTAAGSVDLTGYTALFRYVAGAGAALQAWIVLRYARLLTEDNTARLALISMTLCTSGALLYFGYVEFYVPVFTASALFLFSGMRCAKDRGSPLLPSLALLLAVCFHLSAIVFLPALLFLFVREKNAAEGEQGSRTSFRLQAALYIIAVSAAVLVYSIGVQGPWIALSSVDPASTLFSAVHARDVLNNILLAAPMALAALLMLLPALRTRKHVIPRAPVFAGIAACWWLVLMISQPAFAMDWDIFAVFGLALAGVPALLLVLLPAREQRAYLSTQMAVQPVLFLLPWLMLHLNQDTAVARYSDLTEMYSGVLPPAVVSGFHETLRSEAAGRSAGLEEIRRIEKMIALTNDSYEYMKLLRALSQGNAGTSEARPELRRILAHLRMQPDSVLDRAVGEDAAARALTLRGLYPSLVSSMGKTLSPSTRYTWLEESLASSSSPGSASPDSVSPGRELPFRAFLGGAFPILAQLGNLAYAGRDYTNAERWYLRAAADSVAAPSDGGIALSHVHAQLGIMRFTAGAHASAIASFLHATTYPSAPSSAWSNLGFALFRSGMFVESAVAFRTTLRMDSSDINALYCLGRLSLLRPATARFGTLAARPLSPARASRRPQQGRRHAARRPVQTYALRGALPCSADVIRDSGAVLVCRCSFAWIKEFIAD
jgi:tetratricopeptide (TPR) repeat protein